MLKNKPTGFNSINKSATSIKVEEADTIGNTIKRVSQGHI
jgi:hypothetical protein